MVLSPLIQEKSRCPYDRHRGGIVSTAVSCAARPWLGWLAWIVLTTLRQTPAGGLASLSGLSEARNNSSSDLSISGEFIGHLRNQSLSSYQQFAQALARIV